MNNKINIITLLTYIFFDAFWRFCKIYSSYITSCTAGQILKNQQKYLKKYRLPKISDLSKEEFLMGIKLVTCLLVLLVTSSCLRGATEPLTLRVKVPDGPPAYQAGYWAGCRTALSIARFRGSRDKYNTTVGNGIYQDDPTYQKGWGFGWYTCIIHSGTFATTDLWKNSNAFLPQEYFELGGF